MRSTAVRGGDELICRGKGTTVVNVSWTSEVVRDCPAIAGVGAVGEIARATVGNGCAGWQQVRGELRAGPWSWQPWDISGVAAVISAKHTEGSMSAKTITTLKTAKDDLLPRITGVCFLCDSNRSVQRA